VLTDWNEYRHPDLARVRALLRRPVIIDARNLYDPAKMQALGFAYYSVGRRPIEANVAEEVGY
jgi:UDPglucose 6-dehydrogenase